MHFDIFTLFPGMFQGPFTESILKRDEPLHKHTTMRIGEDMSLRSRHEDRADARARQWRRAAFGAAAV